MITEIFDILYKLNIQQQYNILQLVFEKYDTTNYTTSRKYILENIILNKINVINNDINDKIINNYINEFNNYYKNNKDPNYNTYIQFIIEIINTNFIKN